MYFEENSNANITRFVKEFTGRQYLVIYVTQEVINKVIKSSENS